MERTCTKHLRRVGRGPGPFTHVCPELTVDERAVLVPPTGSAPEAQSRTRLPEITQPIQGELGSEPRSAAPGAGFIQESWPGSSLRRGRSGEPPQLSGPEGFMVPGGAEDSSGLGEHLL